MHTESSGHIGQPPEETPTDTSPTPADSSNERRGPGLSLQGYPLSPLTRHRMNSDWALLRELALQLITDFDLIFIAGDPFQGDSKPLSSGGL